MDDDFLEKKRMKGHLVPYLKQPIYRVKIIWTVLYGPYSMGLFEGFLCRKTL